MKFLNYFLFSSLLIFVIACDNHNKVEPCENVNLEETIVGTWAVDGSDGVVEFKSDGTLIDDNDVLLGVVDGLDEKSYVIDSDLFITLNSSFDGLEIELEYAVTSYTCDEIILDAFFYVIKMTRQ